MTGIMPTSKPELGEGMETMRRHAGQGPVLRGGWVMGGGFFASPEPKRLRQAMCQSIPYRLLRSQHARCGLWLGHGQGQVAIGQLEIEQGQGRGVDIAGITQGLGIGHP